jgi:hypothetical protein
MGLSSKLLLNIDDLPDTILFFLTANPQRAYNMLEQHENSGKNNICISCCSAYPCKFTKWAATSLNFMNRGGEEYSTSTEEKIRALQYQR